MEKVDRKKHSKRFRALVEDALDEASQFAPEGFDLGPIGVVFEVQYEGKLSGYKRRAGGGYTPGGTKPVVYFGFYWFSDDRRWVQAAMLRGALKQVEEMLENPEWDNQDETEDR